MKHIIASSQFTKKEIEKILKLSSKMEKQCKGSKIEKLLKDKVVACMFFEPSTRTRLSFEAASLRLGAGVISVENAKVSSSAYKGETIEDTSRMLCSYADLVVIRHPEEGTALRASSVATRPIINAGDGTNEHPTQALLDLYTIKKKHKSLDNLSIAFVGDALNSRTIHSLVPFLKMYSNNIFYFVSPKELALSKDYRKYLVDNKVKFKEINNLENILSKIDVLYMTRIQKERFKNISIYNKVKDLFLLKVKHLKKMKKNAIIMHPLPRINEVDYKIDKDSRAAYFRQAQNGLYVRMALLLYALEI